MFLIIRFYKTFPVGTPEYTVFKFLSFWFHYDSYMLGKDVLGAQKITTDEE